MEIHCLFSGIIRNSNVITRHCLYILFFRPIDFVEVFCWSTFLLEMHYKIRQLSITRILLPLASHKKDYTDLPIIFDEVSDVILFPIIFVRHNTTNHDLFLATLNFLCIPTYEFVAYYGDLKNKDTPLRHQYFDKCF